VATLSWAQLPLIMKMKGCREGKMLKCTCIHKEVADTIAKQLSMQLLYICISLSNKSDISYLKTSRAFDVLIHSGKPNSVGIATLYAPRVFSCSLLAPAFPLSVSLASSRLRCLCFSVSISKSYCGRLLIAATQSSRLNCRSRLK